MTVHQDQDQADQKESQAKENGREYPEDKGLLHNVVGNRANNDDNCCKRSMLEYPL